MNPLNNDALLSEALEQKARQYPNPSPHAREDAAVAASFADKKWAAMPNGTMREGLGAPYFRHLPLEALAAAAASFEYGAASKYKDRNWEGGLPWQQMIDSLRRHLDDFERRSDYDNGKTGSGMHQTCMIMASAMMLCSSVIRGIGEDNRLIAPVDAKMDAKDCSTWIKEQLKLAEDFKNEKS